MEAYICDDVNSKETRDLQHLVILAKNLAGWKQLIKLVSFANRPDIFYYKPRIDFKTLREYCGDGNFICIDGHLGSCLSHKLLENVKAAARCSTEEDAKQFIHKEWVQKCEAHINELKAIFGDDNVYLEVQLIDAENIPVVNLLAKGYRYLSKQGLAPCVATADSHYCTKDQAILQRIVLCTSLNKTLKDIYTAIANGEDVGLSGFFKSSNYYIPSYEEMAAIHTQDEIENTIKIAEKCEAYDITNRPMLPKFPVPDGQTAAEYLRQLCREGWKNKKDKIDRVITEKGLTQKDYGDRFEEEFGVITKYGLEDYFLIVWDIIRYVKSNGWLVNYGRGSAAGSILLYLLDITNVDPIEYNLLFSRFLNAGRLEKKKAAMPDVDLDLPKNRRKEIIEYIRDKYGRDNVCQIVTIGTMGAKASLKDVLRAYNTCSPDEQNMITSFIIDEAKISDELQEEKDKGHEIGVLEYCLENRRKELEGWCSLQEDGSLVGPLAARFKDAITLVGTARSTGKHASGIIITAEPVSEVVPLIYDSKNKSEQICGFDLEGAEMVGGVKIDILGLSCLDKCDICFNMLRDGE